MKTKSVKIWLLENDITQAMIATDAKRSRPLVCLTIAGERNSQPVIEALKKRGCPADLLCTTEKMKGAA